MRLMPKIGKAECMLVFEVLPLGFEESRLVVKEFRGFARDFWILAGGNGGYRRGKRLGAGARVRRLHVLSLSLAAEDFAKHPFSHAVSAIFFPLCSAPNLALASRGRSRHCGRG
jgi:hypothetical protein